MSIHYALEIFTDATTITNLDYGIIAGVFRFITDRPGYSGFSPYPTYGSLEIDADGSSLSGANNKNIYFEGYILKEGITGNPVRSIDITACGGYATSSSFSFKIRNDIKFWKFCSDNIINLTGRRVIMWVVIDNTFYQIGRGRITNNPYTEVDYQFSIEDDAALIHKNIPPKIATITNAVNQPVSQVGDPIPVVFGNVAYTKLLKEDTTNHYIPLTRYIGKDYNFAGATNYIVGDSMYFPPYVVYLFTNIPDKITEHSLIGKYLTINTGTDAPEGQCYKIKDNAALVNVETIYPPPLQLFPQFVGGYIVAITLEDPIATSDFDILTIADYPGSHIVNAWGRRNDKQYRLRVAKSDSGTKPTTADTWMFSISDYAITADISYKPCLNSNNGNFYTYNSSTNTYENINNLIRISGTTQEKIELIANQVQNGSIIIYEDLKCSFAYMSMLYYNGTIPVNEYHDSVSEIAKLTDKDRSTYISLSGYIEFVTKPGQLRFSVPAASLKMNGIYDEMYFLVDMNLSSNAETDFAVGGFTCGAHNCYNVYLESTTSSEYWDENIVIIDTIPLNLIPNDLLKNVSGDDTTIFGKCGIVNGTKTYRYLFKITDINIFDESKHPENTEFLFSFNIAKRVGGIISVQIKEAMLVGRREIDTISSDIFTMSQGETINDDGITPTDNVYTAFRHILEDYDGIPAALIDYGDLSATRSDWKVSRTLTEQKNSVDYLTELAAQSFVALFGGRTGKRVLRAMIFGAGLTPIATFDETTIVRDSIRDFTKSDLSQLYNSFYIQFSYNQGSHKYVRAFNITNLGAEMVFPAATEIDSNGNPLWWGYFGGLQCGLITDPAVGYVEAKEMWERCQTSFTKNQVIRQAQNDLNELPWYSDSTIFDSTDISGSGVNSSAWKFLVLASQWATLQKDNVTFSVPINATNIIRELMDIIQFKDIIYTNSVYRTGFITSIEPDIINDQLKINVMLQPLELQDTSLIIERGPLLNMDTITETGNENTITEIGA